MRADDFVKIVRKGSDKLRVDDVVVTTNEGESHGKGMLQISRERLELDMTLNVGDTLPEVRCGNYTKRDRWKLTGVLEDELRFRCDVWPETYSNRSWPSGITKYKFGVNPIYLVPSGLDAMSAQEHSALLDQSGDKSNSVTADPQRVQSAACEKSEVDTSVHFDAILFEYPTFRESLGDKITGEIAGYDFTLASDNADGDLQVSLSSKKGYRSASEEEDWKKFRAMMDALAFTHGAHPWPYRLEYWRGGRKIADQITCADRLPRTSHTPFDKRLAWNARVGNVEWDYLDALSKAAAFFESGSTLSEEVANILFLFREADDGVHSEITTTVLCTLFENLVRVLFRELKLEEKALQEDPALAQFEQAKSDVLSLIAKSAGDEYERVRKVLATASPFSQREMLQAVARHFELKWETDLESIFKTWQQVRNRLVHNTSRAHRTEDQWKELLPNESRIAGGINVLLLKLFGYSGLMRASALEQEGYRTL
jgi:hypothetical protein